MPSYMAFCEDGPKGAELRQEHLYPHLSYIESIMEHVQVAGPMCEDESGEVDSSCFVFQADTLVDAKALLAGDPYHAAGVFAQVRWFAFTPAAGAWAGGKTW